MLHLKEDISNHLSPFMNKKPLPFAQSVCFKRTTADIVKDFNTERKQETKKKYMQKVLSRLDNHKPLETSSSKKLTLVKMLSKLNNAS